MSLYIPSNISIGPTATINPVQHAGEIALKKLKEKVHESLLQDRSFMEEQLSFVAPNTIDDGENTRPLDNGVFSFLEDETKKSLIIYGDTACGKSFYAKHFCFKQYSEKHSDYFAVYVPLHKIKQDLIENDLVEATSEYYQLDSQDIKEVIQKQKIVWLFDGYSEMCFGTKEDDSLELLNLFKSNAFLNHSNSKAVFFVLRNGTAGSDHFASFLPEMASLESIQCVKLCPDISFDHFFKKFPIIEGHLYYHHKLDHVTYKTLSFAFDKNAETPNAETPSEFCDNVLLCVHLQRAYQKLILDPKAKTHNISIIDCLEYCVKLASTMCESGCSFSGFKTKKLSEELKKIVTLDEKETLIRHYFLEQGVYTGSWNFERSYLILFFNELSGSDESRLAFIKKALLEDLYQLSKLNLVM